MSLVPTNDVVTSLELSMIIDRATYGNRFEVDCGEYRRIYDVNSRKYTDTFRLFLFKSEKKGQL